MKRLIAPSVLAAAFLQLGQQIQMLNQSTCDWIHLDVMDGVYVPNISFGFPVIEAISHVATKPLDVHLMIVQPERYISRVQQLGARLLSVHQEACTHLHRTLQQIHDAGMQAGVVLNPATSLSTIEDVLEDVDVVMLMSVNPGFGGQAFIEHTYSKIERLRRMLDVAQPKALIEVDGGVNIHNAPLLFQSGANVLVAGSSVFKAPDPVQAIADLRGEE